MDSKSRLILSLVMSSVMVLMVTLLVTFLNLGLRADFLFQWAKAYVIAWPVATTTACDHAERPSPDRSHHCAA